MALTIRTTGVQEFLDAAGDLSIKALIMGAPSAGKTRSASYWPSPIFADCEKGRMSLADRKMPYADIVSIADMDALLFTLEAECRKPPAQRKYRTLVIDTLDAYQRIVIAERLKAEKKEALSGFGDWGFLDAKMTALVSRLLRLPMNLVVNLHIKETKDGEDGPTIFVPKLKGDIREQIAADFDLVGFMSTAWRSIDGKRELARTIQWHPEPKHPVLKDRSGSLPKTTDVTFSDADWQVIFEAITHDFDDLPEATEVETMPTPPTAAPVTAGPGGALPIEASATEATAKGAKKAPAPKVEPAARPVATPVARKAPPAAAKPAVIPIDEDAPKASAPKADPGFAAPPPTEGGAPAAALAAARAASPQELVADQLGGEVIATEAVQSEPEPEAEPEPAANALHCGDSAGAATPKPGCGKDLAGDNPDFVNIAQIKYGTSLCMNCMKAAAAA